MNKLWPPNQQQKRNVFFIAILAAVLYAISPVRELLEPFLGYQIMGTITVAWIVAGIALWGAWLARNQKV